MDKKLIITKIKELRKKKNITQTELAQKLGVSNSYIYKIESGNTNASIDKLQEILTALESDISNFIDTSEKQTKLIEWVEKAEEALSEIKKLLKGV